MAGVTTDIKTFEYGVPDQTLVAYGIAANQQLYSGAIALVSGSGASTTGYLKNAATPGSSDLVAGIVDSYAGGCAVSTSPGLLGGSTDNALQANVRTGTFFVQNSALNPVSVTQVGKTVYYQGENASGPIVSSSSVGGTLPSMGILLPQDPGFANNYIPGSNYWPVKLNVIGGP
jgi:hypothetical protein